MWHFKHKNKFTRIANVTHVKKSNKQIKILNTKL